MALLKSIGTYVVDDLSTIAIIPPTTGSFIAFEENTSLVKFWDGITWGSTIDLADIASVVSDGQTYNISRGNATENTAPNGGEVASPINGDTSIISLTSGKLEFWKRTAGSWVRNYIVDLRDVTNLGFTASPTTGSVTNTNGTAATLPLATTTNSGLFAPGDKTKINFITVTQAVDLDAMETDVADITTLSGVASNATTLGTFTGTTIPDSQTIKAAMQALETYSETLSGNVLTTVSDTSTIDLTKATNTISAAVKFSTTEEHNLFELEAASDGVKVVTNNTVSSYDTIEDAEIDGGLAVGSWFVLDVANSQGVFSFGQTGPFYRKTQQL